MLVSPQSNKRMFIDALLHVPMFVLASVGGEMKQLRPSRREKGLCIRLNLTGIEEYI